ncbi:21730_t:CDS:2 [Gigaspora margarita]|uniref:21730_t:CDS:1 n=1 Tax=Gigaspora margarita TaxID=4874 RepID=A0ABN7WBE9_GIGMA|nr:21730_t:CDS:2 [Gigaspora margarita]
MKLLEIRDPVTVDKVMSAINLEKKEQAQWKEVKKLWKKLELETSRKKNQLLKMKMEQADILVIQLNKTKLDRLSKRRNYKRKTVYKFDDKTSKTYTNSKARKEVMTDDEGQSTGDDTGCRSDNDRLDDTISDTGQTTDTEYKSAEETTTEKIKTMYREVMTNDKGQSINDDVENRSDNGRAEGQSTNDIFTGFKNRSSNDRVNGEIFDTGQTTGDDYESSGGNYCRKSAKGAQRKILDPGQTTGDEYETSEETTTEKVKKVNENKQLQLSKYTNVQLIELILMQLKKYFHGNMSLIK